MERSVPPAWRILAGKAACSVSCLVPMATSTFPTPAAFSASFPINSGLIHHIPWGLQQSLAVHGIVCSRVAETAFPQKSLDRLGPAILSHSQKLPAAWPSSLVSPRREFKMLAAAARLIVAGLSLDFRSNFPGMSTGSVIF